MHRPTRSDVPVLLMAGGLDTVTPPSRAYVAARTLSPSPVVVVARWAGSRVLLAAAALDRPWRRLVPAAAVACLLRAVAYSVLGGVSAGLFDLLLFATLLATVLVLLVGAGGRPDQPPAEERVTVNLNRSARPPRPRRRSARGPAHRPH